jgi:hypothetical protein
MPLKDNLDKYLFNGLIVLVIIGFPCLLIYLTKSFW